MSKHGPCGKEIPGGTSGGHCAKCHENFRGTAAFDNHLRRRDDGSGRSDCQHPAAAFKTNGQQHPYWQDDKGTWHYGAKDPRYVKAGQ
jgi:hypothetical protein